MSSRISGHGIQNQRRASSDRDGGISRKVGERKDSVEVRFAGEDAAAAPPGVPGDPQASRSERFERQFLKTKLCAFWEKNRCTRGSSCKYAHGEHELQATPDLTNTALCREMSEKGRCDKENCPFAHSWETLRATEKFYKTTMCSFFRYGRCRLGQLCRHAHSREELMQAKRRLRIDEEGSNASFDICGMYERQESAAAATTAGGSGQSVCGEDKDQGEDLDDDFGSPAFERNVTLPASFVQQTQTGASRKRAELEQRARRESWAEMMETGKQEDWASNRAHNQQAVNGATGTAEEDDGGCETGSDDFDDVDDMWARMQSMPASFGAGAARAFPQHVSSGSGAGSSAWPAGGSRGPTFAPIGGAPPMRQPPPQPAPQPFQQAATMLPCAGTAPGQGMSPQMAGMMGGVQPQGMMFMAGSRMPMPTAGMQQGGLQASMLQQGASMQMMMGSPSMVQSGDDSDEELTLGPATSPMGATMQTDHWCRSTSLPAPSLAQMQQGMHANQQMQPMLMVVPMMLMPRNYCMTGAATPQGGLGGAMGGILEGDQEANNSWGRQVSAPANCSSDLRPKIPQQDLAKALCAQVVGCQPVAEFDQRELEADLLRSMMPDSYED